MFRALLSTTLLAFACAGCGNSNPPAGAQAARMTIKGADGRTFEPLSPGGQSASVLLFVLQDCPICNAYAPRVRGLASQFALHGVRFYLVHVDPAITSDEAAAHAKEYGYPFPVLIDRRHELVRRLGIVAVPTAVVLGPDGSVRYKGRIDDRYFALGKPRQAATTDDLRHALAAVVEHRQVTSVRTRVVGCSVPELSARDR